MSDDHLSAEEIARLSQREAEPKTGLAHFLCCPECQGRLRQTAPGSLELFEPSIRAASETGYLQTVEQVRRAQIEVQRGERLFERYLASGEVACLASSGLSLFTLGHLVCRHAEDLRLRNFSALQELCQWLTTEIGEPAKEWEFDVATRLSAELANCWRLRGDLLEAHKTMRRAQSLVGSVTDRLTLGIVHWLNAVLLRDLNDHKTARSTCGKAIRCFEAIQDKHRVGGVRFLFAKLHFLEGELEKAADQLTVMRESEEIDDVTRLSATHLLTKILVLRGDLFQVPGLLTDLRNLAKRWTDSATVCANTDWLVALILGTTGFPGRAAAQLVRVAAVFEELELPLEAALARIDQAVFELEVGAESNAVATASGALGLLSRYQVAYPETFAAVKVLADAVKSADLSRQEYLALRLRIEQARSRPAVPGEV